MMYILGILMLLAPIIGLVYVLGPHQLLFKNNGWRCLLFVYGGTAFILVWVGLASYLLTGKWFG